jgi:hypothetical protein
MKQIAIFPRLRFRFALAGVVMSQVWSFSNASAQVRPALHPILIESFLRSHLDRARDLDKESLTEAKRADAMENRARILYKIHRASFSKITEIGRKVVSRLAKVDAEQEAYVNAIYAAAERARARQNAGILTAE